MRCAVGRGPRTPRGGWPALARGGAALRSVAQRAVAEGESEAYHALAISKGLALSADVQAIAAPGFDRGRGPAALVSVRVHLEL